MLVLNINLKRLFEFVIGEHLAKLDTKTKILIHAEKLFAKQGFNSTSLREITTEAEVNLASVNYHFGSKKTLIQAVLSRYLALFMPQLIKELDQAENNLASTVNCFFNALRILDTINSDSAKNFLMLVGRGYSESQGHLRRYIQSSYAQELNQIFEHFNRVTPHLNKEALFWRLHFCLGAMVFTMSSSSALSEISESDWGASINVNHLMQKLVPFINASLATQTQINLTQGEV